MRVPVRVKRLLRRVRSSLEMGAGMGREALALRRAQLGVESKLGGGVGRVALVGCGAQGAVVLQSVELLEGWTVAAVCDVRWAAAEAAVRRHVPHSGPTVVSDFSELLEDVAAFDVLVIATTAESHVPLAEQAMAAGVTKLLVEKPIAPSLALADRLAEAATKHRATVAIDHTRRWLPGGAGLRRLLRSGVIGRPRTAHFLFGRAGFAMIGSHLFDFARWVFEDEIVEVSAQLDEPVAPSRHGARFSDPGGRCSCRMHSGLHMTLDLSQGLSTQQMYLVVAGDAGRIELDERLGTVRLVGAGGRVWEDQYAWPGALPVGVAGALLELASGGGPACSLADGRAALEAVIACHLSHRQGGAPVALPIEGPVVEESFPFA